MSVEFTLGSPGGSSSSISEGLGVSLLKVVLSAFLAYLSFRPGVSLTWWVSLGSESVVVDTFGGLGRRPELVEPEGLRSSTS